MRVHTLLLIPKYDELLADRAYGAKPPTAAEWACRNAYDEGCLATWWGPQRNVVDPACPSCARGWFFVRALRPRQRTALVLGTNYRPDLVGCVYATPSLTSAAVLRNAVDDIMGGHGGTLGLGRVGQVLYLNEHGQQPNQENS